MDVEYFVKGLAKSSQFLAVMFTYTYFILFCLLLFRKSWAILCWKCWRNCRCVCSVPGFFSSPSHVITSEYEKNFVLLPSGAYNRGFVGQGRTRRKISKVSIGSSKALDARIGKRSICRALPWHFLFNKGLNFVQVGDELARLLFGRKKIKRSALNGVRECGRDGAGVVDFFACVDPPRLHLTWDAVLDRLNLSFTLRIVKVAENVDQRTVVSNPQPLFALRS